MSVILTISCKMRNFIVSIPLKPTIDGIDLNVLDGLEHETETVETLDGRNFNQHM